MAYTAHFPISSFLDVDGKPLENGYVYIGTAGLDPVGNPITVYWDAAATQVAAQPIRTIGGYPSNNGVRSRLYVAATDYSIKVTNVNGTDTVPVALYNAEDAYAGDIIFLQAGLGAVPRTVESKLRDTVSVKDFGAVGDGTTDDTAAIQAALNTGKSIYFPEGTYIVSSTINATSLVDVVVYGAATIKAANSTDFTYIINFANTTDVTITGLTFDANKANRGSATNPLSTISVNTTTRCALIDCVFKNALGTASSAVTVAASGGCVGLRVIGCSFLDGGTSALVKPADGIFVRGDYCVIDGCYAKNITDTAYVLEGCNFSRISNCTAENVTALAAVTNDTASDVNGNQINDVTGSVNYVGSTGGVIGIAAFGAGNVRGTQVSNVTVRIANGATGLGPLVQVRQVGAGRVIGAKLDGVMLDSGTTSGVVAQGFLIEESDDIQVQNAYVKMDTSLGSAAAKITGASTAIDFIGAFFRGAYWGLLVSNTSQSKAIGCTFQSQSNIAMYADNTATLREYENRVASPGVSAIGSAAGASMIAQHWQSWTPTYSTDIGNAAASFTATPTTTLARISRDGNVVTVIINFSATLLAINPVNIRLTLPSWCSVANSTTYSPANILNDVTYETGIVRTLSGSDQLLFYRANFASYSTNANVEGRVSFTFEVNN